MSEQVPKRVLYAQQRFLDSFPELDEETALEMAWSAYNDYEEMKNSGVVPEFYKFDS